MNNYQVGFIVWVDVVAPDSDSAVDRAADSLRKYETVSDVVSNLRVLDVEDCGEVEPETVEVCPDCFDVFAVMSGATDWETDPARFDRLAEMFDGCRVGDVSAVSVGFSRHCDTCDTVLQGDRFRVDILPG